MKRFACAAALLVLLAAGPAPAFQQASESRKTSEDGSSMMLWAWANFLLLAGGLAWIIRKNAGPYFAQRSLAIRKAMIEAEAARAESDARVADVDRRLATLQAEIDALRHNAREEAEAGAEHIRRETAAEMAKIQGRVAGEIAAASKAARLELRRHSAELALQLAETKIAARMSPQAEDRLVSSFVAKIAASV